MAQINIPSSLIRLDTSRSGEYLYADRPQRKGGFLRFLGKAFSFLGPIGAAVSAFIPGFGLPLAAALYGTSRLTGDAVYRSDAKAQARMNEYNQEQAGKQIIVPGFFEESLSASEIQTEFMAPSQFDVGIQNTIVNREVAINQNLQNF